MAGDILHKMIILKGEEVFILPERAVFWPAKKILVISDLHLGKVNHFRRSGIPVPQKANQKNLELMINLFQHWQPERVIFLGDLFHSHYNQEWEVFGQVLNYFPAISFELVKGNHDIMSEHQYLKHKILVHDPILVERPFIFSHNEIQQIPMDCYLFSGHIHPGIEMKGMGRQKLRLPCFLFQKQQALLPAFGQFTGIYTVTPKEGDKVFLLIEDKVIEKE